MKPTQTDNPEYYHKVVDCQYACPAHTPVPEYIRLIAQGHYTDAYMVNWESNVFPGILGRTCDRPCEPACRRVRVEEEPVAICRLKRVAADNKTSIVRLLPSIPKKKNKHRLALIGAGPASLTVARDLMPLGYTIDIYDENTSGGGFMRSQIPSFRLPKTVLEEEVGYASRGATCLFNRSIDSFKAFTDETDYDAIFIGTGAPKGKDTDLPGREQVGSYVHIGINWLASVAFGHVSTIGKKVIVLGGGNTAMDCCRTARRLGGQQVAIAVRSTFEAMKASPWEKEDAKREGIPFYCNHNPLEFVVREGKLIGVLFDKVESVYDSSGRRTLKSTEEEPVFIEADEVLVAIGQEAVFPWIEQGLGLDFDSKGMPVIDPITFQSTLPNVFFGGDAAYGPENIITAVAHGHQAAISIDKWLQGQDVKKRPAPNTKLFSTQMGVHEWNYDSQVVSDKRYLVPHLKQKKALANISLEVELGFDKETAFNEAQRCLNCDVQTIFTESKCIECDACTDICPTSCITFTHNGKEDELRQRLNAPADNKEQDLLVSDTLKTQRVLIKDENVCIHCGLCAERCPTSAWDMQKYLYSVAKSTEFVSPVLDQLKQ